MSKITARVIEEIQQRCDIVDIIAQYVPLKKAGKNFKALCPFHHEKTASFTVSADKQIFHCFGCGAGGNVIGFIMKYERMEFPEAVRFLAEKTGMSLADDGRREPQRSLTTELYRVNELAAEYFHRLLLSDTRAQSARRYLAQRQVGAESIAMFRLGVSLDSWDGLLKELSAKGITQTLLLKAGLIISGSRGGCYDRFRSRIIFPIFNSQGKIIGFGGRGYPQEDGKGERKEAQPKYLNTPETEIYKKGSNLYGFNFAKEFIQKQGNVIVAEGYLDVIVPVQAGIRNITASLGTSFTTEQIRLLKRYAQDVVMVFDPDTAGEEATLRSLEILTEEGLSVRIARLPPGEDPDMFVRRRGADEFRRLIGGAKSIFDYSLDLFMSRFPGRLPEGKAKIAQAMMPLLSKAGSEILRMSYVKKLAEALAVPEEAVRAELKKIRSPRRYLNGSSTSAEKPKSVPAASEAEKMLLAMLFDDKELIPCVKKTIACGDFSTPLAQRLARYLFENGEDVRPAVMLNRVNDNELKTFVCDLLAGDPGIEDKKKSLEDCIRRIKRDKIVLRLRQIQAEIASLEAKSEHERIKTLLREYHALKKEQKQYEKEEKRYA